MKTNKKPRSCKLKRWSKKKFLEKSSELAHLSPKDRFYFRCVEAEVLNNTKFSDQCSEKEFADSVKKDHFKSKTYGIYDVTHENSCNTPNPEEVCDLIIAHQAELIRKYRGMDVVRVKDIVRFEAKWLLYNKNNGLDLSFEEWLKLDF